MTERNMLDTLVDMLEKARAYGAQDKDLVFRMSPKAAAEFEYVAHKDKRAIASPHMGARKSFCGVPIIEQTDHIGFELMLMVRPW